MLHRIARLSNRVRGWLSGAPVRSPSAFLRRDLLPLSMLELESRLVPTADFWGPAALAPATPLGFANLSAVPAETQTLTPNMNLTNFRPLTIDQPQLKSLLAEAPLGVTLATVSKPITLSLPTPSGGIERFKVWEYSMMEPGLAAQFPDIHTYRGQDIDDQYATLAADETYQGFHASVLSPNGSWYIDPYYRLSQSVYAAYSGAELVNDQIGFLDAPGDAPESLAPANVAVESDSLTGDESPSTTVTALTASNGTQLRLFRLAVAATGEYTAFQGGTVALGQSAIVTAVNRVNQVYEQDLAVQLVLVLNNSSLVYTNAATDPYTNNDAGSLLTQNQANLNNVIGSPNYDIGHVFSTAGGGLASLGVVGNPAYKARGETGTSAPNGDAFYIDYVAHEMGHQFGGNHTYNGTDPTNLAPNRVASAAYEPGSGSTIMAYAGIGGADDYQQHSDPYFHFKSLDEITNYLATIPNVGTTISSTNLLPGIYAGGGWVIPSNTPFAMTGAGVSYSGDPLTYCWEEYDLGPAVALGAADNGSSPLYRSFNPSSSPTRYFPQLSTVLAGSTGTNVEVADTTSRNLRFNLTVRDIRSGAGTYNSGQVTVSTVNTGASFAITDFNSPVTIPGLSNQTLTWNVAGTTGSNIDTSQVRISISSDGGNTFTAYPGTYPNTGTATLSIPNNPTTQGRFKVEAVGNIFYDISNANFTITKSSLVVDNLGDTNDGNYAPGQLTLREAVALANAASGPQTIAFSSTIFDTPQTISLTGAELPITNTISIYGPGSDKLFVSGNNLSRVFNVSGTATITNMSIVGGSGSTGGGIYAGTNPLTLDSVAIYNNKATVGAGIFVPSSTSLITITNSTISGNTANGGGGIYFFSGGGLRLVNSSISGNVATTTANTYGGGGIYFFGSVAAGGFNIINSTIAGNTANSGAGVVLRSFTGTANIQSSTITDNSATSTSTASPGSGGGGIAQSSGNGNIVLTSSIVSGNSTSNSRADIANGGSTNVTVTFSAIGSATGFALAGGSGNNLAFGTNLKLGSLGAFADQITFVALLAGSPCIDAGSNPANQPTDGRGNPFVRTYGASTDIGAFEAQPATFTVSTVSDVVDGNYSPGHLSLREALNLANNNPGADTILFSPLFYFFPITITLTGTELPINDSTTIVGPGSGLLTISANNQSSIFEVYAFGNGIPSNVTISGLTLTGGSYGGTGGGLHIDNGSVTLDQVVLTGNRSVFGGGVGVEVGAGILTIRNSTLSDNSADMGGGIYFSQNGALLLENSTVSGNTASDIGDGYGGGGLNFWGTVSVGGFTIRNSTFIANYANSGGGVCFNQFSGNATFQNDTITGNASTSSNFASLSAGGGGIDRSSGTGTLTLTSTIDSGNLATTSRFDFAGTPTVTATYSAIGSSGTITYAAGSGNNLAPGIALNLGTLGNNGGPVATIPLNTGSPAIDAGSNPANLSYDARGSSYPRVRGAATDIGAYETQPLALVVDNAGDVVDGDYSPGHLTLREAIGLANANPGADAISFSPSVFGTAQTITLAGTELPVTDAVTITGPGANLLTITGNNVSRVFDVTGAAAITNMTITGGTSNGVGGGITVGASPLTLDGVTLSKNHASEGGGLGIATTTSLITVNNCTISGNTAINGGGVYFFNGGGLRLTNSALSGNVATNATNANGGGGLYFFGAVAGNGFNVINSTIAGNSANSGGGIVLRNFSGTANILSSTITGNSANSTDTSLGGSGGGGIALGGGPGNIVLASSIVSNNAANNARADLANGGPSGVTATYSAIGNGNGFAFAAGSGSNLAFGTNLSLGTLANYGGPAATIPLLASSPAIDAGLNPAGVSFDARGTPYARISGGAADIGAYERQALNLVVDYIGDIVDGNYGSGQFSLREAIGQANANAGVPETITFSPAVFNTPQTIILGGTELLVSDNLTITGPGAGLLTVSGNSVSRVFDLNGPGTLDVTMTGLTISSGKTASAYGGGIFDSDERLTLDGVVLTGNTTTNSGGGGLGVSGPSPLVTLRNSTISSNVGTSFGGGIDLFNGASLLLLNSTVSGNSTTSAGFLPGIGGGGLYFGGSGNLTVRNSTISGNNTNGDSGGGLNINSLTGNVLIQNSTITANTAAGVGGSPGTGGGGFNRLSPTGTITVASTIVSGNTAGNAAKDIADASGSGIVATNSAIGVNAGFSYAAGSAYNLAPGAVLNLGPLQNNGGPTQTVALVDGSAAIDAGSNPAGLTTDQRGLTRVAGAAADIGAYEYQFPPPTVESVVINDGSIQRSRITSITITFSTTLDVNPFGGSIVLTRQSDNAIIGGLMFGTLTANSAIVAGKTVTTLNFGGSNTEYGSLRDGNWTLTISAGTVVAGGIPMAANYTQGNIKRLFGDSNGDGTVDGTDFADFGSVFGQTLGLGTLFDFNQDGTIDGTDFAQFGARFGLTL